MFNVCMKLRIIKCQNISFFPLQLKVFIIYNVKRVIIRNTDYLLKLYYMLQNILLETIRKKVKITIKLNLKIKGRKFSLRNHVLNTTKGIVSY